MPKDRQKAKSKTTNDGEHPPQRGGLPCGVIVVAVTSTSGDSDGWTIAKCLRCHDACYALALKVGTRCDGYFRVAISSSVTYTSGGCDIGTLALARLTGHSVRTGTNSNNILIAAIGGLSKMNLLIVPIKNKVSSAPKLKDKVSESNLDDLVAETKVNGGIEFPILAIGHVKALAIVLSTKFLQNRVKHDIGVSSWHTNVGSSAIDCHPEAVQLADVLASVNAAIDKSAFGIVGMSQIKRKYATVDKTLVGHRGEQQTVRLIAVITTS
ncbi:hypothetical protein HG531_012908 [Fusarium graminearum]|nr:hypothetical protein HG531_012908 [Fusarium graminearum]